MRGKGMDLYIGVGVSGVGSEWWFGRDMYLLVAYELRQGNSYMHRASSVQSSSTSLSNR